MIFHENADEPCVYKKASGSAVIFLVLYVDYILLSGNDVSLVKLVNMILYIQYIHIIVVQEHSPLKTSEKRPTFWG